MLKIIRVSGPVAVSLLMLVVTSAGAARGQTTAFTYQGQLSEGGMLASGSHDLRFALFDSAAGGAQIGANQTVPAVPVSDGVFTVQLDFGVNAFPGANRFVEIAVKPADGGSFTTLAPRQQISSSPYAIRTLSAATADALSSACVGCVQSAQITSVAGSKVTGTIPAASVPTGSGNYIQNSSIQQATSNFNISGNGVVGGNLTVGGTLNANVSGNFIQNGNTPQAGANFNVAGNGTIGGVLSAGRVGIGTSSSAAKLGVSGSGAYNAPGAARFDLFNTTANTGFLQHITDGGLWQVATTAGATRMVIDPAGNIGIGTASPTSKVEIAAQDGLAITGFQPYLTLRDANAGGKRGLVSTGNGDLGFYTNSSIGGSPTVLIKDGSGHVGIGTASPDSGRLQVDGGSANSAVYATTGGSNVPGIYGGSSGLNGTGVTGEANSGQFAYGVWGKSAQGYGVHGRSTDGRGVFGESDNGVGVYATGGLFALYAEGEVALVGHVAVTGYVDVSDAVFAKHFVETSDRNMKANFGDVESQEILRKVATLPIQTWNFQGQPETERHLGPTAQDFHAAFELGQDDRHIATLDANGVALAAIQGLYQTVQEKDRQLQELQVRVRQLERQVQNKRPSRGSQTQRDNRVTTAVQ